jgi:oligopeptide transport system substrate-binding protein
MRKAKKVLALMTAMSMVAAAGCSSSSSSEQGGESNASGSDNNVSNSVDASGNDLPVHEAGQAGEYTYNTATSTFPTNWNPHQEQTAYDSDLMTYLQAPFYEFDYNDEGDSYALVPLAVTGDPEDITADYVGQYGVEEGDTAKVWKFTLRDDLQWEDGTKITAQDYVTSAALLLDPVAQNYRADMLYQGNLVVYNAKNYLYQGQHAYASTMIDADYSDDAYIAPADLETDADGYYVVDGQDLGLKLTTDAGVWDSSNSLADYAGAGYFDEDLYSALEAVADDNGIVKVNEDVMNTLNEIVAQMHGYESAEAYAADSGDYAYMEWEEMVYFGEDYPELTAEDLGVIALSDNEVALALDKPLEGFYLLYSLTDSWLVNEDLYKQCESVKDGVYTNSYGTSADTTISYGPYKLESFQQDKQYVLAKNDKFFGFTDDTYQTTKIVVDYVKEASTRLEMFLNGELDTYGLASEDMETYASSDYTYYSTGDSTFFMALNPDLDALTASQEKLGDGYNKTILTVKEFRMALSFALDRTSFALASVPTNSPAFGVFSSMIISDPETAETYRSTDEAKQVLVDFWGLTDEIGDGKMYADVDEAIESITGYNLDQAKILFDEAYDKAIEEGLMKEGDVIDLVIGVPNSSSSAYSKGYDFLVNCYTDAVKGTKLEGKLQFSMDDTIGNAFAQSLQTNQVDILFLVGWTGSALDPYGLMEAYTSANYQYDPSWDTTTETTDITLTDGKTYTATVWDWTESLSGIAIKITDEDGNTSEFSAGSSDGNEADRFLVLAGLEGAVLETYDMIPMVDDASAQMRGMQIEYHTEDYIFGMGFGGVKYYTYNYDDAQWDEFVASQGGTLNYK